MLSDFETGQNSHAFQPVLFATLEFQQFCSKKQEKISLGNRKTCV